MSGVNILAYILARSLTLPRLCEQSAVPHLNHAALKAAAGRKRREAWTRSAAAIGRLHSESRVDSILLHVKYPGSLLTSTTCTLTIKK